jgi:hypothetical protein
LERHICYELTSAEIIGVLISTVVGAGISAIHAVPITPRRIPKRAIRAITWTQVIFIFFVIKENLGINGV